MQFLFNRLLSLPSITYFKLAFILPEQRAKELHIWAKYRKKVTNFVHRLQATNGLKNPRFLAR